jgi:hypothetical protein
MLTGVEDLVNEALRDEAKVEIIRSLHRVVRSRAR